MSLSMQRIKKNDSKLESNEDSLYVQSGSLLPGIEPIVSTLRWGRRQHYKSVHWGWWLYTSCPPLLTGIQRQVQEETYKIVSCLFLEPSILLIS